MKNLIILLSTLFLLSACTKVLDKLTTFSFKRSAEFTIPANTILGVPVSLSTGDVQTSYISEFENNNASIDNIDYIKLTGLELEILDPTGGNFNFLKDVETEISATGLANKTIASRFNITNDNVGTLVINTSGDDLKPYLTKDKFKLELDITTDELVSQDYKVKATTTFEAKANLR